MTVGFQLLFCGFDLTVRNRQGIRRELVIGGMYGLVALGWVPFVMLWVWVARNGAAWSWVIPWRRPFGQFSAVGGGGEDFLELGELSLLLRGEGSAQSGEVLNTLLSDGALGVRHLVGFIGVESACGGFVRKILNGLPCVRDCGQRAAITGCRPRQCGLRLCQRCRSGWVYFFAAFL